MLVSINSFYYILTGVIVTLQFSIISIFFGIIIGILLAIIKVSNNQLLKFIANIYTSIFRGTPLLIQLMIIYYALPNLVGIKLSIFSAGVLTFSLNSGAYVSEIIKAGILSIDSGQTEAAKTLNIPKYLIIKDIIMPQALKIIFPSLINELIDLVKESAIISIIGELDLTRRAQIVSLDTYSYFTPMLCAASIYYIVIFILNFFAKFIQKKL